MATTTSRDYARLVTVTIAEIACLVGSAIGSGVFGPPQVAEAAGGALSADATMLAPASQAFSIWSVIYLGLALYTIWQWLPAQRAAERHRQVGWWIAASMVLNAAWLLVVRQGWLWMSVLVIVVLVLVLGHVVRTLAQKPRASTESVVDVVVTDATMGLYTGWVSVAVCANIAATLVDSGVDPGAPWPDVWAITVLVAVGLVGVVLALVTRANIAIAVALAWGLSWIAVGRLNGEPESIVTAVTAIVVAFVLIAFTGAIQARGKGTVNP
ncbi:tryptophan-rich sensory protein [Nocardioides gilvus]|uniref:tryptophan-rich sensory protein n=1 Tax=Nocardioides gilvus TaxID=1735589 RepID=UPI000D745B35|nr:tryptophan-rich sensory protein [Nocardioides gilvus]